MHANSVSHNYKAAVMAIETPAVFVFQRLVVVTTTKPL